MNRKHIGKIGEEYAAHYLASRNYTIVARNAHFRSGELDIVAQQKKTLIFIEVKTRTSTHFDEDGTSISRYKLLKMRRAALDFLMTHWAEDIRFDAIHILLMENGMIQSLCHLEEIA